MIKVRWQGQTDRHMAQAHGWDFINERSRIYETKKHPGLHYKQYIVWLVQYSPALRVWLNDEIVWDYQRDWIKPPIDLQQIRKELELLIQLKETYG